MLLTSYNNKKALILENSFPDNLGVRGDGRWVLDTEEWLPKSKFLNRY